VITPAEEPTGETPVQAETPAPGQVDTVVEKVVAPASEVKEFSMTARQWEFDPNTIIVNQGDTVKLTITSADVTHGFNLPDFGIRERLDPGKTVEIEFVADKKGTFTFACHIPCGRGHGGMSGKLIVE
jgi:cytochrome c oxidase subunit 2|tara:strand:+ start:887 stop:1270 length:384 start_codon:yes stop_codon:yes gene_type:complete